MFCARNPRRLSENSEPTAVKLAFNLFIKIIGYATLESDDVGVEGDRLYFDEECCLRGSAGRFQIDKLIPVSGIGVVIGTENGEDLADVNAGLDGLRGRVKFL